MIKIYQELLLKLGWKFMTNQKKNYSINKEIRIKTPMLRSDLCDFSDAYIIVKGNINLINPDNKKRNKAVAFKNNTLFINCISKS